MRSSRLPVASAAGAASAMTGAVGDVTVTDMMMRIGAVLMLLGVAPVAVLAWTDQMDSHFPLVVALGLLTLSGLLVAQVARRRTSR